MQISNRPVHTSTTFTDLPVRNRLHLAYALTLILAALLAIASLAGLLFPDIVYPSQEYRLNFVANDVLNLLIGLPILFGSLWLTQRGSLVGLLFWPGALFFVLYNDLVYVLSMPLNAVYFLYLLIAPLSFYLMTGLVAAIDSEKVSRRLAGAVAERLAGGALCLLGLAFCLRSVGVLVQALGDPASLPPTEMALLLTDFFIAPAWMIGGILLWRRRALGYVVGAGLLFQASTLFFALIIFMILQPLMMGTEFLIADIVVVAFMGLIIFIPFGLFARGMITNRG